MPSYRDGRRTVVHIERCRRLRRDATDAERRLWQMLRAGRLQGFKFRRQHEMGPYVLDFVCVQRRLVVEADGGQHFDPEGQQHDRRRDAWLRSRGPRMDRAATRQSTDPAPADSCSGGDLPTSRSRSLSLALSQREREPESLNRLIRTRMDASLSFSMPL